MKFARSFPCVIVLALFFSIGCRAEGWMGEDSVRLAVIWKRLSADVPVRPVYKGGKLVSVEFSGSALQKPSVLFSLLDSLNGNGEWNEIDNRGVLEPALKARVQEARQSWFSWSPGQKAMVVVLRGKPATLKAESLDGYTPGAAVPLVYRYKGGLEPFGDFERYDSRESCSPGNPCTLIHRDNGKVQAIVEGRHIRMGYRNPDLDGLAFPQGFAHYSDVEKERVVAEFRAYFRHELAVMLRAFVHSAPGLFNWQTWHWPVYAEQNLISAQELKALFSAGHPPALYRVLQLRCAGGETVRFETDGNGAYYMEAQ